MLGLLITLCLGSIRVAANQETILVLGDSLSAAHNIPIEQGWASLLQQRLAGRYRVVNASISGETSDGGLARLPKLLTTHEPSIVLVELGANDGLRGQPLSGTTANMEQIIQLCNHARARVLLLGVELPINYGSVYRTQFRQLYAKLARRHGLPLVPFILAGIALNPNLMQADGLHPTAAAQARVLDNIWPTLAPLLESRMPQRASPAQAATPAALDAEFKSAQA